MAGTFNIIIDQSTVTNFFRSLDEYADYRSEKEGKSYTYSLNRTAQNVAGWSAHFTHHADISKLRTMLGQPQSAGVTRTGRPKRNKAQYTNDAGRILAARMVRAGRNPRNYSSAQWQEKVRKFVGRTLRSVNFMKSGWIKSYQVLSAKLHQQAEVDRTTAFGRQQEDERGSYAKNPYPSIGGVLPAAPAPEGLAVEIWNTAVNPRNKTSWNEGLGKWGAKALEQALAYKAGDMMDYIAKAERARAKAAGFA